MRREDLIAIPGMTENITDIIMPLLRGRDLADCFQEANILKHLSKTTVDFLIYKPVGHIPRNKVDNLAKKISVYEAEICGSYRRGVSHINDVDIIIPRDADLETMLKKLPFTKPYSAGKDIVRTFVKIEKNLYATVDIFLYDRPEKAFMMLYTTGSANFNLRMRHIARTKNMKLNQRGLYRSDEPIFCKTEKEIFDALNMTYKEPKDRNI